VAGFNHNYQRVEGAPSVCRKLATVCNRSSERFRRSCTCVSKKAFSKLEVVLAKADGVASLLLGNAVCHFAVEVDGLLGLLVPGLPWLDSFSSPFCFSLDFGVDLIFFCLNEVSYFAMHSIPFARRSRFQRLVHAQIETLLL